MFGFFSVLPFSTSGSLFFSGHERSLTLYIKKRHELDSKTTSSINIIMNIQQNPEIIL